MDYSSFYENFHFKLGKIVVSYNLIEYMIIGLICNLVDYNDITAGFKKCRRKRASELLRLLKIEANKKIKDETILNKFDTLHDHIKKVIEIRNDFLHSIYINKDNFDLKLTTNINTVSQVKIREFEKAETNINSGCIYNLEGMDNFIKILNDIYEEANSFFVDLSKITPLRQILIKF